MKRTARTILTLGAAMLAFAAPIAPALSGEAEARTLQSFAGSFSGRGELRGEQTETVACQLTLTPNQARLRYSGRCVIAGERIPLRGTISYSDARDRYEATATGMGTVAGQLRGDKLTFTMGRNYRQRGQQGTFQVSFTLGSGSAVIDLRVVDQVNGNFTGRVPLSRS